MAIVSPKQVQNLRASALNVNSSVSALVVHSVDADGNYVSPGGGSTQVSIKEILTSSGASVMDSTNNAIGVTIRAGAAAGTEYTDGDVDLTIAGTAILFDNSTNTLRPVSVTRGLPVNVVAGSVAVSTGSLRVHQSTAADLNVTVAGYSTVMSVSTGSVRVHQSTAADLNVTVAGYSTTVNVSSLAGAVIVRSSAVDALVTVYQSTFAALQVQVNAPSTANSTNYLPVRITNSTAFLDGSLEYTDASTTSTLAGPALTYNNSSANTMRLVGVTQPLPVQMRTGSLAYQSTCFSTMGNNSTSSTIVSSVAAERVKVYAYSITSTMNGSGANTVNFCSSLANVIWPITLRALSSGVTGANLAVTPPAFLFATEAASPLVFKIGPSTGSYTLAFSYFMEA